MSEVDLSRYAAVERQKVETVGEGVVTGSLYRYVRLHDEPMHVGEVVPFLVEQGLVKRVPSSDPDGDGERLEGWGSTYFAVPWDRSVER